MAIFIYQKHPDHCLGGENYPHFRNQADKIAYARDFINLTQGIDLQISRSSFDTAVVNLNVQNLTKKPHTIAGIATGNIPVKGDPQLEYWWVTGWNPGANSTVISFNLSLDYWLTYWPLALNKTLVRVHKRHTPRFWKHDTKADPYLTPRFTLANRSLVNQETELPLASANYKRLTNSLFKPKIVFDDRSRLNRYLVIVITIPGGEMEAGSTYHNNYYSFLGYSKPKNQHAMVIFGRASSHAISSWLSSPGITHSCYVWLDDRNFNVINYWITYSKGKFFTKGMGDYFLDDQQSTPTIDYHKLNCVRVSETEIPHTIEGYIKIFKMLVRYIALTAEFASGTRYKKKYAVLRVANENYCYWLSESEGETYSYYLKDLTTAQIPNLSLFFNGQKAGIKNDHWSNQVVRQYENVYFTSLDAFNEFLIASITPNKQKITLDMGFKNIFKGNKAVIGSKYQPYFQLKMYTHFKYLLNYQTAIQEYQPWTFSIDSLYGDPTFRYYWLLTIQNSYFVSVPEHNLDNDAHTFAMIAENQSKAMTYNDEMLKFYQQQGVSFQTGFDQALFFQNWTRKFNKLQFTSLGLKTLGQIGLGAGGTGAVAGKATKNLIPTYLRNIPNIANKFSAIGASHGAVAGGVVGSMNIVNNIFKTSLDNQLREKKATYGIQSLLAQQTDLANQPATTAGLQKLELNYWITLRDATKLDTRQKPYLTVLAPGYNDFIAQALIYHKYGYLLDQEELIDFNDEWTRYYFNYWQIHNIEQALVKTNLNSMVINWFNSLFNQGIRLWNIYNEAVVFNDYSKENWETKIIRTA